jgi:hypothetical protein
VADDQPLDRGDRALSAENSQLWAASDRDGRRPRSPGDSSTT